MAGLGQRDRDGLIDKCVACGEGKPTYATRVGDALFCRQCVVDIAKQWLETRDRFGDLSLGTAERRLRALEERVQELERINDEADEAVLVMDRRAGGPTT